MSGASGLEYLKPFLPGLEPVLADPDVSEIMINGPHNVWIERDGKLEPHAAPRLDQRALERAAIHIARPLGLDPAQNPIVDARLEDGSRVAISCVRQVLQKVFPKNSVLECRSPSGLWECGKAERSWRSFSKPQRESVPFGGFPLRRHFHQVSAFLSF